MPLDLEIEKMGGGTFVIYPNIAPCLFRASVQCAPNYDADHSLIIRSPIMGRKKETAIERSARKERMAAQAQDLINNPVTVSVKLINRRRRLITVNDVGPYICANGLIESIERRSAINY